MARDQRGGFIRAIAVRLIGTSVGALLALCGCSQREEPKKNAAPPALDAVPAGASGDRATKLWRIGYLGRRPVCPQLLSTNCGNAVTSRAPTLSSNVGSRTVKMSGYQRWPSELISPKKLNS